MSTAVYKVFDGGTWQSICDCNLKIQKNGTWETVNPKTCNVKAWTGNEWCRVVCPCACPSSYTYNIDNYRCELPWTSSPAVTSGQAMYNIIFPSAWSASTHGALGVVLYDDITSLPKPVIGFPTNTNPGGDDTLGNWSVRDNNGAGTPVLSNVYFNDNALGGTVASENRVYTAGIWATGFPNNEWLNVNYCLTTSQTKQVILAAAADNQILIEIKFDSQATFTHVASLYTENVNGSATNEYARQTFKYMHLFPITLPAGTHIIRISGMNITLDAGMSVEIYDITRPNMLTLMAANNAVPNSQPINPYIIFSTKNLILPPGQGPLRALVLTPSTITYAACPTDQTLDICNGVAMCKGLDIVPCNGRYSNLEINIWFDNSGSMNDTLSPLQSMAATTLKNCLLSYYGNDLALYNERVKVLNMFDVGPNPGWDYNERFIKCFSTERNFQRNPDLTVLKVINLTFSDESDPYGYGTAFLTPFTINDTRTATYNADVSELRNKLASVSYSIKGHNFIVNTLLNGATEYQNYIDFATAAMSSNFGSYTVPNSLFDLNAANKFKYSVAVQGATAAYYKDVVMAALQVLLNEDASFINC
jgi:hypothetical protein